MSGREEILPWFSQRPTAVVVVLSFSDSAVITYAAVFLGICNLYLLIKLK
jgi:hypothetical protein